MKYKNMVLFLCHIWLVTAQDAPFALILWYVAKTIYL